MSDTDNNRNSAAAGAVINMLAPDVRANPFPVYASLRQSAPRQVEPGGLWAVSRYRDVQYVLKHPELFASSAFRAMLEPDWIPRNPMAHSILCLDPPEHTKRRALVAGGFTSRALAGMRPFIESLARELVDGLVRVDDYVDFVADMGTVLPGRVIAELIGLDPELHRTFRRLSSALASITPAPPTEEQLATVVPCLEEMQSYLREVLQKRRGSPVDDVVSSLIAAEIDGRRLSDDEIVAFLFILVPAGVETTSKLLSKCVLRLAQHPELLDLLRADPSRIPDFVEEQLRFDPSIHGLLRLSTADVEISGTTIPGGSLVLALLGAANHDPDVFPDPERFDIDRKTSGHFGFGHGIHACLGASLGILEASIAVAELCRRCERIELRPDTQLAWNTSLTIHGLRELPVRFVPSGASSSP